MKLTCTAIRKQTNESGMVEIVLTTDAKFLDISALKDILAKGKKLTCEIKQLFNRRSLDANAYFHVLVNKIAEVMNLGEEETKINLVLEYGSIMRDENGEKVGFKLPASVDVKNIYKYAKWFDERIENGHKFNCYIIYEHTHNLDSKQMARLIDGTVYVAKEQGIETMTPDQLAQLKQDWGR